jgi:glycerol-3-phosphate O-acyltransferase 3/4
MVQLLFLTLMTGVIGAVPDPSVRKWMYSWAARSAFRILSRSFSAVISFHDTQYRARSDGICVANHTTPIDVVILQNDRTYALVSPVQGSWAKAAAAAASFNYPQFCVFLNSAIPYWGEFLI